MIYEQEIFNKCSHLITESSMFKYWICLYAIPKINWKFTKYYHLCSDFSHRKLSVWIAFVNTCKHQFVIQNEISVLVSIKLQNHSSDLKFSISSKYKIAISYQSSDLKFSISESPANEQKHDQIGIGYSNSATVCNYDFCRTLNW